MQNLIEVLKGKGVDFILEQAVTQFTTAAETIKSVKTPIQEIKADEVIIASGAWSEPLLKQLGIQLSVQAGKGYRLNVNQATGISLPAILM